MLEIKKGGQIMKKFIVGLMVILAIASQSMAVYVTSNTAQTQLTGSITIGANGATFSDFVQTGGMSSAIFTVGSGNVTAEILSILSSVNITVETTAIVDGTPLQVKTNRAKVKYYNTGATATTPECVVYWYN